MLSRCLELRFYQCQEMHRRGCQRQRHRQHGFQRNETDVDYDNIRPRGQALAFKAADIGLFHGDDVGMAAQRWMQLLAPDIDGKHQAGAASEQHLGETAGRCADVETDMTLDVDRILLQRARQLYAAARDKGMGGLRMQHGVRVDALGRLHALLVIGRDETRFDCRLRPGPAFEQAALDQQCVRALAGRGHAPLALCHVQLEARAGAEAVRSAAMRTQLSNAVKSCQMSAGACRGVTSAQPCKSSAWIIIRLSVKPKFSTVNPDASTSRPSRAITSVNSPTRSA